MAEIVIPRSQSTMKVIRNKCKDCCCGDLKEVEHCQIYNCSLYPYRFGQSPESYVNEHPDTIIVNEKGEKIKNAKS